MALPDNPKDSWFHAFQDQSSVPVLLVEIVDFVSFSAPDPDRRRDAAMEQLFDAFIVTSSTDARGTPALRVRFT